jgi:hypothetical protein
MRSIVSSVTQILPRASIVMRLRGSSKVVFGKCLVIRLSDLTTLSIALPPPSGAAAVGVLCG